MVKSATHGTLAQLTAELHKRTSRFDLLLEEVERRHEVNREGGLAEWVARNLLLALRWLGSSTEAGAHFHPASVWLGGAGDTPPPSGVSQALSELPTLVGKLVDALRPIFLQDHSSVSSTRRPSDLHNKLIASVDTFHSTRATLDLVIYHVVASICTLRSYHLYRLNQALPAYLNKVDQRRLLTEPGAELLEDLPVCTGWSKAPAASGKFQRLEIPCRAKLEEMVGVSSEELKLCMFTQVGCGETADSDDEGQWEGYTVRVCVSVEPTALTAYKNLQLTISSMTPGCEVKGLRTTLSSYASEEWSDANDVVVTLPTVNPGHQHDLLVLGSVRSVGLVEVVFYVGAAPWTREDHRRLRAALAVASGVELDQLRFAEVGEVDEDGCAGVLCAFPDHKQPRIAQATLLNVLSDCTTPGDRGLPYAVKYFGAAQPTTPDISAQLKFRFQHLHADEEVAQLKPAKGKAVAFNSTKDVGDTLQEGACLAERWGLHSARVREEVFRQNLCTVLDRVHAESGDTAKWKKELTKTLTSQLYDHPLSELRQTRLVKELLWIALSDTVDDADPNERAAIIASLRFQRHVANTDPRNPPKEARHTLFSTYPSEVTAGLHRTCVAINDELQRMNRFLDIATHDLPVKELLVQEDADRSHVATIEYEERVAIMRSRRLAVVKSPMRKIKKEKSSDYHIQSPIRPKSPMPKKKTPTSARKTPKELTPTPTKKKKTKDLGHVPIWQRAHALHTHQLTTRSTSQGPLTPKGRSARDRSQTPDSRISRNSSLVRTGSVQYSQASGPRSRSRPKERPNGLNSIKSQLRKPGTGSTKRSQRSVTPPSRTGSRSRSRSRSQSAERDLSDVLRSPAQSFTSSRRSSRWLNESGANHNAPARTRVSFSGPPSPFGKTTRSKKHLTQPKKEDVVGPWLSDGATTPPSLPLQTSPKRSSPKKSRFPFELGDRVCVKCGITNVQSIFTELGWEWRDNRDRYVGCPGYIAHIDHDQEEVEVAFDPSAVSTHNTKTHAMTWPIQALEAEATSPVPLCPSPVVKGQPSPVLSFSGPAVSDSPPMVKKGKHGTHGTHQTKRTARLACFFASPAAAIIVAAAAARA